MGVTSPVHDGGAGRSTSTWVDAIRCLASSGCKRPIWPVIPAMTAASPSPQSWIPGPARS